jgi:hypothetical protein
MNLVIGKLYLITSVHSRGLISKGSHYNYNVMIGVLRHNDIVLILDKDCGDCGSLKVLTSDGIIGHTSAYESDTWQLVEAI